MTRPMEKFCVVCKAGSHRSDWQAKEFPACDGHSASEVAAAIAKLQPPKPAPPPAPVAPPAQQAPVVQGPVVATPGQPPVQ